MTEEQIIEGFKARKRDAQKALYDTHARVMYGVCLRYCACEDAAKDLLQEGFIKVFTHIDSFKGIGSFEGWLKRIFINLALESIRKNKTTNFKSEDIENLAEELIDDSDEMETIPVSELLKMVNRLPAGYAAVFNLYAIEDFSHKEIALMLNISEGTSRSQYLRARQALRGMVDTYLKESM